MSQTIIREITGIKTIELLVDHLNTVKHKFENDPIEIVIEHDSGSKDKVTVYFKRVRNNE
jgi:hypothetical protein